VVDGNSKYRFSVRSTFAIVALFSVVLAIPLIGTMLVMGVVGVVVAVAILIGVQFPLFLAVQACLGKPEAEIDRDNCHGGWPEKEDGLQGRSSRKGGCRSSHKDKSEKSDATRHQ
jgi:hypothetical protein